MILNIENDLNRFKEIVKGKVRKDLRRYMSSGEMIGRQGNRRVSIPLPQIGIPRFRYGKNETGGVGQGEGEAGDPVGEPGDGSGQAGDQSGTHAIEAEITIEELAEIMREELALPRIEPRGSKQISSQRDRYTGISKLGPEALRHNKRTFREALKRQIASGSYAPARPVIVPIKDDKRYRSWKTRPEPQSAAVILYMMDVSGSMGDEQKEIVRLEAFWIDTWLRHNYKNVETRFIIHDASAKEVPRDVFFRTKESGGTLISSAYTLAVKILEEDYPAAEWNIYPFHFSDGDNWSANDTQACMTLLEGHLLPVSNQFSYGQVDSEYGSGQFYKDLNQRFGDDERVVTSRIPKREAIMDSIKEFLSNGK
ncbi:MAG: hypothetical protein CL927_02430 [Deltaproteobacteria bacterium]|nr:hypothetical protein [Deltaproteobacteria bacterium]HCH65303.1 hypothetical protein [Deltaproteobacteria bacterium]